jgi:hypothetical protein
MSSVVISGDTSGAITLAAPAIAGTNTLSLPAVTDTLVGLAATQTLTNKSIAATQLTGTIAAARLPAGSVLQVVSNFTTTFTSSTSSTPVDTTLSASITPSSTSSKIVIFVSQSGTEKNNSANDNGINLFLVRNSTSLFQWTVALNYTNSSTNLISGSSINYVDSPATTSSVTYKTQYASYNNSGNIRIQSNNDRSQILLMEIAG